MSFINHPFVKPDTVEARLYQEILVTRIIEKGNSLVVAPTALGKTIVALMLAANTLKNSNMQESILFLAPTKPLAVQHEASFKKFLNIPEEKIISITGTTKPEEREQIYKSALVINATPQTIENDLLTGKINLKKFGLVIFDEAHRAIGEYAYVFVNLQLQKQNPKALVLALTASPGSEEEHIQDVCRNLSIKNIEIKETTDSDVAPYVNEIKIDWVKVELPPAFIQIKNYLEEFQRKQLSVLKGLGFAITENKKYYNRVRLLEMQARIRQRLMSHGNTQPSLYVAASKCAAMMKVSHAEELIETQGIGALVNYFDKLEDESAKGKSKAAKAIIANEEIQNAIILTRKLFNEKVQHPKYEELKKIILKQLTTNPKSKVIVFNHYRDSIKEVVEFLSKENEIKPVKFIGQATKGKEKGMSQKIQQEVLQELRDNKHNVLVASSLSPEEFIILQDAEENIKIKKIGDFINEFIPEEVENTKAIKVNKWKTLSSNGKEIMFKEITHVHKHKRTNFVQKVKLSSGFDTLVTENHSLISFNEKGNQKSQNAEINKFIELLGKIPNSRNISEINIIKKLIENMPNKQMPFCFVLGITQAKVRIMKSNWKFIKAILNSKKRKYAASITGLDSSTITACSKRLFYEKIIYTNKQGKEKYFELTPVGIQYADFLNWFFSNVKYHKGKYRCNLESANQSINIIKKFCEIKIDVPYGKTAINTKITLNTQLANFLGFYVAEGHARNTKKTSSIHLAAQKLEMQDAMEKSITQGLQMNFFRNWRGLDINSKMAYLLIKYVFQCGETAYKKEVPECIFNAPNNIKWAFIEAYCKGDGHISKNKIQFTTVSRKLVTGIVFLLRQLGIKKIRVQKNDKRTPYQIEIYESLPFASIQKNLGKRAYFNTTPTALNSRKAYYLFQNNFNKNAKRIRSRTASDTTKLIYYDYIKKIDTLEKQPPYVYDLSVKDNETFCGGTGLITLHNSVAEEGLDIPSVDLVVFFEPVPSEIRTIQRRGRTGRFAKGKTIILMAKNTRDEAFYWAGRSKERKMKETLREMKKTGFSAEQTILQSFDQKSEEIIIFVDSREQASSVTKKLFEKNCKTILKQLEIGDYILSKDVCVERKTIEDFVASMIDGRLFNQLVDLRENYPKPMIMLEGNINEIFSLRDIHRNSIIGALTSIALDYQVPIINTKDSEETAEYLYVIAKREQIGKDKEVGIRFGRKGLTTSEKQRFIIEGLPLVGPTLAKNLLEKFGSVKEIINASEKELTQVEGVGKKKAHQIQKILTEKYDENKKEEKNDYDENDEEELIEEKKVNIEEEDN